MNLAIVSGPNYAVPPFDGYGGVQRGVYDLARGLADRGHQVSVLASADSALDHSGVSLIPTHERALAKDERIRELGKYTLAFAAWKEQVVTELTSLQGIQEIDVLNLRCEEEHILGGIRRIFPNIVQSISTALSETAVRQLIHPDVVYTAHTEAHKRALGNLPEIIVAPYGIHTDRIPFSAHRLLESRESPSLDLLKHLKAQGSPYLLHLAGIGKYKGQKTSIEIAKRAGVPIIIAGSPPATPGSSQAYFHEEVKPLFDGKTVHYFGNANEAQKYELMKFATATLFSSGFEMPDWVEPFGRVIAESLACGTPVIGHRHGSFPELVPEGRVGLGFSTIDEAVAHVGQVHMLDRFDCSEYARRHLSDVSFVGHMEHIFYQAVGNCEQIA